MTETKRGSCSVCRHDLALTGKGMVRKHGDCPGGGLAPEYCEQCDTDTHRCPGCGEDVPHGTVACAECSARIAAEEAPPAPEKVSDDFLMGTPAKPVADDADDWIMDAGVDDAEERLFSNKRYRMPDPVTGIYKPWTRCTTMAETISDLYSLNLWRLRMATIGYIRYPYLLDELGEKEYLDQKEHRKELDAAAGTAQWKAGSKVSASWGTKMHTQVERWSRGEISIEEADPAYRDELAVYVAAMKEWDLSPVPELIERRVLSTLYGIAGTFDQAVHIHRSRTIRYSGKTARVKAGEHVVGDLKSGKSLDLAEGEIAIQMAIYAHALKEGRVLVWDPEGHDPKYATPGAWVWEKIGIPVDSVRTDVGVVMHMPVDRPDGVDAHCTLSWVDLEAGWNAVQLCEAVRDWRKTKGLFTPVAVSEVVDRRAAVRAPSWEERAEAVSNKDGARQVYREYVGAHGKDSRAEELVRISKAKLASLVEAGA